MHIYRNLYSQSQVLINIIQCFFFETTAYDTELIVRYLSVLPLNNLIELDELYIDQRYAMDPNFDWKYRDMGCGNPKHEEPCPQSYDTDVYYHMK